MGRPNTALMISEAERTQLHSIVRSRSLPHSLVRRAQIVLLSAEGRSNREVARRCGVSAPVVGLWRQRYQQRGIAGLHTELRPGCPRSYSDEQVAGLLRKVLHSKPAAATHWSVRRVAAHTGISKSTVARYFALFGLQPHRTKSFKLSTDPFFVEKVRRFFRRVPAPPLCEGCGRGWSESCGLGLPKRTILPVNSGWPRPDGLIRFAVCRALGSAGGKRRVCEAFLRVWGLGCGGKTGGTFNAALAV